MRILTIDNWAMSKKQFEVVRADSFYPSHETIYDVIRIKDNKEFSVGDIVITEGALCYHEITMFASDNVQVLLESIGWVEINDITLANDFEVDLAKAMQEKIDAEIVIGLKKMYKELFSSEFLNKTLG